MAKKSKGKTSKAKTSKAKRRSKAKSAGISKEPIDVALHEVIRLLQVIAEQGNDATERFATIVRKRKLYVRVDPDTVKFVGAYLAKNRLGKPPVEATAPAAALAAASTPAAASTASLPVGDRFRCF